MNEKLFTNRVFKIVFILIVGIDLINTISKFSGNYDFTSVIILRYLSLILTILAFISFFLITKFSLPILKIYIVFKLIVLPLFLLLYALKEFVFYQYNRFGIEAYFGFGFSLLLGLIIYYFYKKYKIKV